MRVQTQRDADLVGRCRDGDERAWEELVERFSAYVYAIVTKAFGLSRDDAEEVFQETFARTYERLDELHDDSAVRPWIAQLARRLAIDRIRARSRDDLVSAPFDRAKLDEKLERLTDALEVRDALNSLPAGAREVLYRFFVLDQSYRSISATLDVPMGTVASRISRALAGLKGELEGSHDGVPPS